RSEGQLAVNDLAARFGGGGHLRAAGCHLRGRPLAQAEAEVIAATEATLEETLRRTGGAIIA
ncbi:MAG: bifunctional oligoribonuclease/PAP phosphatase NrnA, partial [Planctomycetes bacterium]|nr:bifunctional oligoribonuclease/PAP phosphatase NrnA [Planctomycetota bacterium]